MIKLSDRIISKKTISFLFFGIITSSLINAQEPVRELAMRNLIDSALQRNYLLQANEKQTAIKQSEIELLKINYQPRIAASANVSYWKWLMPNKAKILGNTLSDVYTDISAYQTIYDWGQTKIQKQSVEDEIQLNAEVRRQIKSTIIWGVTDTYLETLKSGAEIDAHLNALKQLKSHLQYVENLYRIGKVSNVDVLKINVQISVEEKALQKAENVLKGQYIKLKRLCNLGEHTEFNIPNTADSLFPRWKEHWFIADTLFDEALRNHPSLIAADRKISIETRQKELYRLKNRPELYSFGVANWEDGYLPFGSHFNYNIGAGIHYTIPYWGGSSFKTKMMQSDLRAEQITDEKNQTFLDLKKEIETALNDLSDKKDEIASNEKIMRLAGETLTNSWVKYQSGQGPIIDVLDAESILTESTINQGKSVLSYLQVIARLNYLKGNDNNPF
jgi:outer membrane protein TolC